VLVQRFCNAPSDVPDCPSSPEWSDFCAFSVRRVPVIPTAPAGSGANSGAKDVARRPPAADHLDRRDRGARLGPRSSGVMAWRWRIGRGHRQRCPDAAEESDARRQRVAISLDRVVQLPEERPRLFVGEIKLHPSAVGQRRASISQIERPRRATGARRGRRGARNGF